MTYTLGDLTDGDAIAVANVLEAAAEDTELSKYTAALLREISKSVRAQIPIPVPDKLGAVVQTDQGRFIRWAFDVHTFRPWIAAQDHETPLRTDQIGRITEVLSEGVDV